MNGPEHYRAAERLIDVAHGQLQDYADADSGSPEERHHLQQAQIALANAQVHATLADAAATALASAQGPAAPETKVAQKWREVLS